MNKNQDSVITIINQNHFVKNYLNNYLILRLYDNKKKQAHGSRVFHGQLCL